MGEAIEANAQPTAPTAIVAEERVERFGDAGVWLATSGSALSVAKSDSAFSGVVAPDIDWFVARHVSLGVGLRVAHATADAPTAQPYIQLERTTTTIAAGPRIGVDVPIGASVSLYPRATMGFEHVFTRYGDFAADSFGNYTQPIEYSSTADALTLELFAPILLHVAPHFFIGAGPSLLRSFGDESGSPNRGARTRLGGQIVMGVWWRSSEEGERSETRTVEETRERFGRAGQWMFSNEFGIALARTWDSRTYEHDVIDLSPGVDFFVASQLFVGLTGSYFSAGSGSVTTVEGGGVAPRVGYNVPVTTWLSWTPRASVRWETVTVKNASSFNVTTVTGLLYAPFLLHPAQHGFLGFGPYVARDFSRVVERSYDQPEDTTLGLSLIVGGWL